MIDVLQQQNDGRPGVGQAWSVVSVGPVLAPTLRPTARHKASAQANNEAAYAYVTRFRVSRGGWGREIRRPGPPLLPPSPHPGKLGKNWKSRDSSGYSFPLEAPWRRGSAGCTGSPAALSSMMGK